MRVLIALCALPALFQISACAVLPGADKTQGTPPVSATDPDAFVSDDMPKDVPDESDLRPVQTSATGPQSTIAGLGDPGRPGMWLETPLVKTQGSGRVRLASGGGAVAVTLLPVPGAVTAGSRLSLDAMRQLGAPLTELVELTVTPGG